MSDQAAAIVITVCLLAVCVPVAFKANGLIDTLHEERKRSINLTYILDRLTSSGTRQEPTRQDANDQLRTRFVFCGRHTESGHAPDCQWLAAVRVSAAHQQPERAGE